MHINIKPMNSIMRRLYVGFSYDNYELYPIRGNSVVNEWIPVTF